MKAEPPRQYPRSMAQVIVDEALEHHVEGTSCTSLDLSGVSSSISRRSSSSSSSKF